MNPADSGGSCNAPPRPVSLPMYDWPEMRAHTRNLERAMEAAVLEAVRLTKGDLADWPKDSSLLDHWRDSGLLVSQTCGYPLMTSLRGKVVPLVVPHYAYDGCEGPNYSSVVLVSDTIDAAGLEDLRTRRAVINSVDSQSGHNAFRALVAPLARDGRFFSEATVIGSHLEAMTAVANGTADAACVDAVCWALFQMNQPELATKLRPIIWTQPTPGLPLVTSAQRGEAEVELIRQAVIAALSSPQTQESRKHLGICGFSDVSLADYTPVLDMEREAIAIGYPVLR